MLIGLFRLAVQLALASGKTGLVEASILDLLSPANTDQVSNTVKILSSQLPVKVHALQEGTMGSLTLSMLPRDLLSVLHDIPLVSEQSVQTQCPQPLHVARPLRCKRLYSSHQSRVFSAG